MTEPTHGELVDAMRSAFFPSRNAVAPAPARSEAETQSTTPPADTQEPRYALYRLCDCFDCTGTGKNSEGERCKECRGEGKVRDLVAEADNEAGVGLALVTGGREGEWAGCAFGLLDRQGEPGEKWLVKMWLPSPRNVSDAGRVLAKSKNR